METVLKFVLAGGLLAVLFVPAAVYRIRNEPSKRPAERRAVRFDSRPLPLPPVRSVVSPSVRDAAASRKSGRRSRKWPRRLAARKKPRKSRRRPGPAPKTAATTLPEPAKLQAANRLFEAKYYRPALRYYEAALTQEPYLLDRARRALTRKRIRACRRELKR